MADPGLALTDPGPALADPGPALTDPGRAFADGQASVGLERSWVRRSEA